MFKAIIVDDESKLRELLKIKIQNNISSIEVCGEASNVNEAYQLIVEKNPHLVFLDIAMPGASGFELLDKFDKIEFEIIFVTGFNKYALDALKVSAVDYLLKPISNEDLINAVEKAIKKIEDKVKLSKYDLLKHNLHNIGNQSSKISIPGVESYEFIEIADIIRCEGWNKYTKIFHSNESVIISSYNIGVFKEMLEPYDFYTCHKSHIINKNYITKYMKEGTIVLNHEHNVPLARRRRDDFVKEVLNKLVINKNV